MKEKREKMKNTKIINLFGPPGVGKSTGAAYIFAHLKMLGKDCELVTEFAKDKVWEHNLKIFENQMYMLGKQAWKIARVTKEVDFIITDSPIILPYIYTTEEHVKESAVEEFIKYSNSNINFLLTREKEYNPNGRNETLEESDALGVKIKKLLIKQKIPFIVISGNEEGYKQIVDTIFKLKNNYVNNYKKY